MSLYMVTALGLAPVGSILSGLVAETLGVEVALAGGGLVTVAAVAATWAAVPAVRGLRAVPR
jgi:hypothetical protein